MLMRTTVDFSLVKSGHEAIDARLTNWARWCCSRSGGVATSPAFRLYRSTEHWESLTVGVSSSIDKADAQAIQKAVQQLPEKHRHAINWCYVYRSRANRTAKALGVDLVGLAELIHDVRQMLLNRRA